MKADEGEAGDEPRMKIEEENLFRPIRWTFPFILPVWMIAYPIWYHKSEYGTFFQSEADRNLFAESSGPWSHDVLIVLMISFLFACCLHATLLIYSFINRRWIDALVWLGGSVVGLGTTWLTLYLFGSLLD